MKNQDLKVKLADFEFSKQYHEKMFDLSRSIIGTLNFMAPETTDQSKKKVNNFT